MLQTGAKARILFTICSIVIYILGFLLLSHFYGQSMAISAVIPAIVVGWYYGCKAGIITAILSFPINILMCTIVGANWWEKMILSGGGIAGTFALILIGAVVGRISDLSIELKRQHEKIKKEINERKRAEEEARGSSIHLKNIFKTSADGILITDSQGYITMINDAVENMLGYSQNELLGKHPEELNSEEEKYKDQARRFYEALTEKGIVIGFERTWQKRDGDLIDIEMSASILRDNEGKQIGGVITLRDITGRKRAEKDIIETRNFLEDVFKTTVDGIMVTDSQGCIVRVNKAIEKMLGFREDELIGKYTFELGIQSEESKKASGATLEQLFEKGFVNNHETIVPSR